MSEMEVGSDVATDTVSAELCEMESKTDGAALYSESSALCKAVEAKCSLQPAFEWFESAEVSDSAAVAYDYLFKVVLLGDSGVGKSNILLRLTRDAFDCNSQSTVGVEFATRVLRTEHSTIKVQVWDTAGQERYKSITAVYYRGSVGALVVFDVCDRSSFGSVQTWYSELLQNTSENLEVILVANKIDLTEHRQVTAVEAADWAALRGIPYIETSAKDATNVELCFQTLNRRIFDKIRGNAFKVRSQKPLELSRTQKARVSLGNCITARSCAK